MTRTSVVPIPPACLFNTKRISPKRTKYMIVPRTTISSNEFFGVKMPCQSIFQNISLMVFSNENRHSRYAHAFANASPLWVVDSFHESRQENLFHVGSVARLPREVGGVCISVATWTTKAGAICSRERTSSTSPVAIAERGI